MNSPFVQIETGSILYAERPQCLNDLEGLHFINPRRVQGFDQASMQELKDSIKQDGLLEPPLVRKVTDVEGETIQLIAGERRKRCIDKLIENDEEVFDRNDKTFKPASEVYNTITCHVIDECDDELALRLAFSENANSVPLSEADIIDLCQYLVSSCGYERKKVCSILGKSEAWLSHSLSFKSRLPNEAYECLRNGMIPRVVGVKLLGFDGDKRLDLLKSAIDIAYNKAKEAVEEAEVALEQAKNELTDVKDVEEAEDNLQKAVDAVENVKVQESDLDDAAATEGVKPASPKALGTKQMRRFYVEGLQKDLDDADDYIIFDNEQIPAKYVEIAIAVANGILQAERNPLAILKNFATSIVEEEQEEVVEEEEEYDEELDQIPETDAFLDEYDDDEDLSDFDNLDLDVDDD